MDRILFNLVLATEGILSNKLRAFLTALGIIFGVAAVIAMLAIGTGAKQAILDQMALVGTNNIVIKAVVPQEEAEAASSGAAGQKEKRPFSPGLTVKDFETVARLIPSVQTVSPEVVIQTSVVRGGKLEKGQCVGVTNAFFELNQLHLESGTYFQEYHLESGRPVCIIGKNIQTRFFNQESPIGKTIKCGNAWFRVVGVLGKRAARKESLDNLGIRDYNDDIYVPVHTALLRLKNRALVNKGDLKLQDWDEDKPQERNYHQIDRAVVRVKDATLLQTTAGVMARMLKRRHLNQTDYEIEIPELLLEQQQKTQETFNLVLAVIAGISLLVGGIGIMNIMLATVLERIKEIGVRRSLGAKQTDIIWQFLFEAVIISLFGGLAGVLLGVVAASTIAASADIPTVVSSWSVIIAFVVAASVGLVFGIYPAQKAARQDPIKALRFE